MDGSTRSRAPCVLVLLVILALLIVWRRRRIDTAEQQLDIGRHRR